MAASRALSLTWGGVEIARRGRDAAAASESGEGESAVSDVVFVLVTVGLFAVLALVVRGVEKL
ncbi:hypothetical protein [Micromonospora sp. KC723]|uniref:hypothetical protein n=1 Tax=Micromonospora sp. KC723 TaxID=2530381 RepID=UPI00105177B3|nr:hypothetical protein [Micromonospora sp. KC723]TDB73141.1 hypothetical protein E1165_18270 [Micromonospora sp. KC723]